MNSKPYSYPQKIMKIKNNKTLLKIFQLKIKLIKKIKIIKIINKIIIFLKEINNKNKKMFKKIKILKIKQKILKIRFFQKNSNNFHLKLKKQQNILNKVKNCKKYQMKKYIKNQNFRNKMKKANKHFNNFISKIMKNYIKNKKSFLMKILKMNNIRNLLLKIIKHLNNIYKIINNFNKNLVIVPKIRLNKNNWLKKNLSQMHINLKKIQQKI